MTPSDHIREREEGMGEEFRTFPEERWFIFDRQEEGEREKMKWETVV
jgi:hypothetical protein